jgi:pimeloyl-ACP methyl ester carboxylesterase
VLASTGCRLDGTTRELQRRVAARIRAGAPRRALALMAHELVPPRRGQLLAALTALAVGPLILHHPDLGDMATTIEAEDTFDLAHCPTITAPTLIVTGAQDRFYPPALVHETGRLIPNAQVNVIAGRGHITVLGDKRCSAAVTTFLGAR